MAVGMSVVSGAAQDYNPKLLSSVVELSSLESLGTAERSSTPAIFPFIPLTISLQLSRK